MISVSTYYLPIYIPFQDNFMRVCSLPKNYILSIISTGIKNIIYVKIQMFALSHAIIRHQDACLFI